MSKIEYAFLFRFETATVFPTFSWMLRCTEAYWSDVAAMNVDSCSATRTVRTASLESTQTLGTLAFLRPGRCFARLLGYRLQLTIGCPSMNPEGVLRF